MRLLLVGPLADDIGGTTISFRHLLDCLRARGEVEFTTVGTQGIRSGGWRTPGRYLAMLRAVWRQSAGAHVISLHASFRAVPALGFPFWLIARARGCALVFRLFGGLDHRGLSWPRKTMALEFFKRCDVYLAQTKRLVEQARQDGIRSAQWYPTSRPFPPGPAAAPAEGCRRLVFIGLLLVQKGLRELVQAVEAAPPDVTLDVYGPWYDLPRDTFEGRPRIQYRGVLAPEDVPRVISGYDALVLPTYLPAEGYSGVIIEAYSQARPVIATRWNDLPEIVIHEQTGLLVRPGDAQDLRAAIERLRSDPALHARLGRGARQFGEQFRAETMAARLLELCASAAGFGASDASRPE